MIYINSIFSYVVEAFARDCLSSGVNGVIIPDVPLEEESLVLSTLKKYDVAFIRLATLTSPQERLAELAKRSEGFLYAVAVKGTTGTRTTHEQEVNAYLEQLRENKIGRASCRE